MPDRNETALPRIGSRQRLTETVWTHLLGRVGIVREIQHDRAGIAFDGLKVLVFCRPETLEAA